MNNVQEIYTRHSGLYEWLFITLIGRDSSLRQFLRQGHYLKANFKILDAGTGSGLLIKLLWQLAKEQGWDNIIYHGFDFTPAMLERFKQWIKMVGATNISLQSANALHLTELPPEWQNYDLIVTAGMLEYLPRAELPRVIRELTARLKPGGQMLIFISRQNWLTQLVIGQWWQAEVFTPQALTDILTKVELPFIFKRFPRPWSNFGTLVALINNPQWLYYN